MNEQETEALRRELAGLEVSAERPARARRIAEVRAALGEPAGEDTTQRAPRERAVTKKASS